MQTNLKEHVKLLTNTLNKYAEAYYVYDTPLVDDTIYDELYRELTNILSTHPELEEPNSPTKRVGGATLSKFKKVTHKYPLFSLTDEFSISEATDFIEKMAAQFKDQSQLEFICELKIDGLSITLTYENGDLTQAITRGNGLIGENVTENVKTIHAIPLKLSQPENITVTGEIFMPKKVMKSLNIQRIAGNKEPFANCRNAAAGSLRQLNSAEAAKRGLSAFMYTLQSDPQTLTKQSEILEYFSKLNLPINTHAQTCNSINDVVQYLTYWEHNREELPYDIDGVVIKINDLSKQQQLGFTSKTPRWATAFKFKPEESTSIVKAIRMTVGRTGAVTPTAIFDTIQLAGTSVSAAALHNEDYIKLKDIRIGDTVYVHKAGDIIPEISRVNLEKRPANSEPFKYPTVCPECNSILERDPKYAVTKCENVACPAKIVQQLAHFASRDAMNISGLGPKRLNFLHDNLNVKSLADLYELTYDKLIESSGFQHAGATNLIKAISESKANSFERLLYGFGIPLTGRRASDRITRKYPTLETLMSASVEGIESIEGVGQAIARKVVSFFEISSNQDLMSKLTLLGLTTTRTIEQHIETNSELTGKKVVVTGKLSQLTRSEIETYLTSIGAIVSKSVSKNTDLLIAGADAGSKLAKATTLNIPVWSESEFIKTQKVTLNN